VNSRQKLQYENNKKYYLDRNRETRASNRDRHKELKNKPCSCCGGVYPHYVMDFDHVDPATKKMCVSKMMGHSWAQIEAEIAKCVLLCSNCHRIKTYETGNRQQQHTITTGHK
jgi:5-methylcytosine-specific restriction endonuclease McrA